MWSRSGRWAPDRHLGGGVGSSEWLGREMRRRGCPGNQGSEGLGTHLLSTAISFSMLLSFPLRAFFGMHLTANMRPVSRSWARTTSEKAPLGGGKAFCHSPAGREWVHLGPTGDVYKKDLHEHNKTLPKTAPEHVHLTFAFIRNRLMETDPAPPEETVPGRSLRGRN